MFIRKSFALFTLLLTTLAGCGGGSSSSVGGPPPIIVQSGFYEGETTSEFVIDGESLGTETFGFELSVSGSPPTQQVLIRYREFSGTSAIGANQEFRIPSGRFPFDIDVEGVRCTMLLNHTGRFVGTSVSGTVEGDLVCEPGNVTFLINGTFEANLARSKVSAAIDSNGQEPDTSLDFSRYFGG